MPAISSGWCLPTPWSPRPNVQVDLRLSWSPRRRWTRGAGRRQVAIPRHPVNSSCVPTVTWARIISVSVQPFTAWKLPISKYVDIHIAYLIIHLHVYRRAIVLMNLDDFSFYSTIWFSDVSRAANSPAFGMRLTQLPHPSVSPARVTQLPHLSHNCPIYIAKHTASSSPLIFPLPLYSSLLSGPQCRE